MTTKPEGLRFPKQFLWGASTSAHQVEGDNHNNWTVWELENAKSLANAARYKLEHLDTWAKIAPEATDPANYISGKAIDHYNRYEADFDIAKKMHLNAFRFSVEWSRVEPEEGVWNAAAVEHYRQYIQALKQRGLEPVLTLYHWTVPVWFAEKGAFARRRNIQYFVRFADKILRELGRDVRFVVTVNEPDTVASHGYFLQDHPPGQRSVPRMVWVYRNHLRAHKEVYVVAKKISRRFKVGFVKNYYFVEPANDKLLSRLATKLDYWLRDDVQLNYVGRKQDFIGVNYYFSDKWDGFKLRHNDKEVSDMGWELKPEHLEPVLLRVGRKKRPIFVLETGVADRDDVHRANWLVKTVAAVHNARAAGVDVQGYMHWSMLDNFEWAYGRWPRFGLVGIDYEDNLRRLPRRSAAQYARFVKKARGL